MQARIRRATTIDAQEIYEIEHNSFSDPWSLQNIKNDITNPVSCYFVASINANIVGYIGLWNVVGEGQITNLAVSKEYQRQGIANELVSAVVEYSINQQMEFILLEVRASNEAAQSLYKRFEFTQIATRVNYYTLPKEDAIIMKLEVKSEGV
ncbi:MAG: ribosomal-protein-alanine N-acetyltransferase [Epulopiscium sp. Nuni2H_MBin001]|nr:MAG: ribosomal-protein-alanine N-acetyltransferase [Epulopiscium sp. Nuni2H_MBin001]